MEAHDEDRPGMKYADHAPRSEDADRIETEFHELMNVLAAARSYADVMRLRAQATGASKDQALADSLIDELERAGRLARSMRRETHRPGDVLLCDACGYQFVHGTSRKSRGACKRCRSPRVRRWRPTD